MNPKTKNLLVRTLAGAVYIALMITAIFVFPMMPILLCLAACVGIFELSKLTSGPTDHLERIVLSAAAIAQFALILQYGVQKNTFFYNAATYTLTGFLFSIPLILMCIGLLMTIAELFRSRPLSVEHIGTALFGYFWIILPLGFVAVMTRICPQVVFAFFLMIWAYDTFAYLGGSLYGRNKMCERISPKKTWEGTVTGLVLTIVMAMVLPSIPYFAQVHAALWKWAVFAIVTVVFATFGDLVESVFKRRADVKDSGHIMPGHGGILDRFDSMLLSALPALIYALFVMILK